MNDYKSQPRIEGQFAADPDKPGKARVSLRVDAGTLEEYKARHGKGFSGKLSKVIEEFMLRDNENSIPNIDI